MITTVACCIIILSIWLTSGIINGCSGGARFWLIVLFLTLTRQRFLGTISFKGFALQRL